MVARTYTYSVVLEPDHGSGWVRRPRAGPSQLSHRRRYARPGHRDGAGRDHRLRRVAAGAQRADPRGAQSARVAELDGNNNLRTGYTWGPDGLLAVTDYTVSPAKTYVAVNDASGNLVEYLDPGTGTVAASFHYDPWGNLSSATGPAKNLGSFRGKGEYVDSEVSQVRHALYRDDDKNVWLERGPSGESGGLNLYEQYGNDPTNNIDPNGLRFETLKALWTTAKLLANPNAEAAVAQAGSKALANAVVKLVSFALKRRRPESVANCERLRWTRLSASLSVISVTAGEKEIVCPSERTARMLSGPPRSRLRPTRPRTSPVPRRSGMRFWNRSRRRDGDLRP